MASNNNNTKRKKSPWFAFYVDDFVSGTIAMSMAARGAFVSMLAYQFSNGTVPSDDRSICRIIGAFPDEWEAIKDEVLPKFRDNLDGTIANERMEKERLEREGIRQSKIDAAKKRWSKKDADGDARAYADGYADEHADAYADGYAEGGCLHDASTSTSTSTSLEDKSSNNTIQTFLEGRLTGYCISNEIVGLLSCVRGDDAKSFHDNAEKILSGHFETIREYPVADRGDGRRGRVDLAIRVNGELVGVELDNVSPRDKSLFKLQRNFSKWAILCRPKSESPKSRDNRPTASELIASIPDDLDPATREAAERFAKARQSYIPASKRFGTTGAFVQQCNRMKLYPADVVAEAVDAAIAGEWKSWEQESIKSKQIGKAYVDNAFSEGRF